MRHNNLLRTVLLVILGVLIAAFAWMYRYGAYGSKALNGLQDETAVVQQQVAHLETDIVALEHDIAVCKTDFYKEKIAREQLQMAKEGEMIYYLP